MLHNRYRKAKRFKLGDDLEVVDEFSGNHKSHVPRDWDFYDYRGNRLWGLLGPSGRRYFRSRVGQNWDTAYSDFCQVARSLGKFREYWIHDRLKWGYVEQNVEMVEGVPHELSRWGGRRELSEGTVYVNPETKLVSIVPTTPKPPKKPYVRQYSGHFWEDKPRHYGCEVVKIGEVEYVRQKLEYQKRVASGVFKTEAVYIWYKYVPYKVKRQRRVPVHVRNVTNTGWAVQEYRVEQYEEQEWKKSTVSRQEIKQLKLNEKV